MAKKKLAEGEEVKNNIENLAELATEFKSVKSPMPEKKRIALRIKLISLFLENKATEPEQDLMEAILRKERNRGVIGSRDNYLLNKIEHDRAEAICVVKTDDAPQVHHLIKDLECRFDYDPEYNDGKNKDDSIGRYYVYVPRTVPTEHQISNDIARRELKGHPVDPSEYPAPKVLIHRIALKPREFEKWFDVEDESVLETVKTEPEYTF